MEAGDGDDMAFPHGSESAMNCLSSGMTIHPLPEKVAAMAMPSVSAYTKPASKGDHYFHSGWDPIASLSQNENFGGSRMVPHNEFSNPPYPVVMQNQGISGFGQYPSGSSYAEMVPKLACYGSGSISEMVGSFGLPECPPNYSPNKEGGNEVTSTNGATSHEDCQISEEGAMGASPNGKRRKRANESNSPLNPNKNAEVELRKDQSSESSDVPKEQDQKKLKIDQSVGANLRGKQPAKQAKENSNSGEAPKENYIHVRARRGQATNSHSLAERVRREKISERMRLLQELVPGCNKITGKAVMLDEIINYVQSLQQQVEFLSMKLATVNPELNIDIERILSKDILHSRGANAAILGFGPGMNSSHPYPHGVFHGTMPSIPHSNPQFPPLPQTVLDNELQSLFQMGFDSNSAIDSLASNAGRMKSEL